MLRATCCSAHISPRPVRGSELPADAAGSNGLDSMRPASPPRAVSGATTPPSSGGGQPAAPDATDPRGATNPLFNDNRLKLGLFCVNNAGPQMTPACRGLPSQLAALARPDPTADEIGLEAMVTASVWRGAVFGDGGHPSHMEFEPFTWTAALGSASRWCALVATFHTQLANPAFVAKAAATIDHVTGSRFEVNIVAGASKVTHGVFGRQIEDHATRYEHTTAFMEVLRRFWDETEEFDLENDFYSVSHGISVPKPLQRPRPAVMNAAVSERGQQFAAKYADIALTMLKVGEPDVWRKQIGAYRALAWNEHRRAIQIWTHGYLIVRDTEEEAAAYLRRYAETNVDEVWLKSWIRGWARGHRRCGRSRSRYSSGTGRRAAATPWSEPPTRWWRRCSRSRMPVSTAFCSPPSSQRTCSLGSPARSSHGSNRPACGERTRRGSTRGCGREWDNVQRGRSGG